MGTADVSDKQYTGGMFIKDEHGSDLSNDNFPVNEVCRGSTLVQLAGVSTYSHRQWKFILEGEWQ
jgi:hypothetical protein